MAGYMSQFTWSGRVPQVTSLGGILPNQRKMEWSRKGGKKEGEGGIEGGKMKGRSTKRGRGNDKGNFVYSCILQS